MMQNLAGKTIKLLFFVSYSLVLRFLFPLRQILLNISNGLKGKD